MSLLVIQSLHIISVISWMAGLLYLPRLFVYHAQTTVGSEASETFKVMERKLLRYIMTPAMIATWVFGLWLMMEYEYFRQGWMHVKITLVVLMTIMHHVFLFQWKAFERDENKRSAKSFKWLNEVPTVLMIVIIFLVELKPF